MKIFSSKKGNDALIVAIVAVVILILVVAFFLSGAKDKMVDFVGGLFSNG